MSSVNRTKIIGTFVNDLAVLRRRSLQAMERWSGTLSQPQRELLGILARHPEGVSVKGIARIINISSSAVTQRVESLERMGLVARHIASRDNRFVTVTLSRSGAEKMNSALPSLSQFVDEDYLHVLSDVELEAFGQLLRKVAHSIEPVNKG